jgi:GT2 family glycosyltransferase/predicted SAM-dependent methyltransferase
MISIIVPVLNQAELTHECLTAVMENTTDYEIIVVDNGSDPPFKPPFSGFNEIMVIRNDENKGFPVAVNQGLREARGDTIVLLNNDVIVTPGALNRLEGWLESFDIVGPVTNYCAGMQRVKLPAYQDIDGLNKEAGYLYESSRGECVEVNWIIGFCMAFKREVWEKVGDFDESLWPCNGEEIDFCLRAKKEGYKVGIALDTYVHHEGSVTFKDMEDAGVLNYDEVNRKNEEHLAKKWGKNFWNEQAVQLDEEPESGLHLNLGSGLQPKKGYVNIDNRKEVNPDLVCDVIEGLPYNDNSVDSVRAYDFLEHIPIGKTIQVVTEIWRVLKPGGLFVSLTPDAESGQGAFQDPNHVSFWVENSWKYFSDQYLRELYGTKANFKIKAIDRVEKDNRVYHLHVIAEKEG